MNEPTTFGELCEAVPGLRELEGQVLDQRDPGGGSFYCSNFVWMPLNAELKALVGVARAGVSSAEAGDVRYSSRCYELAYVHLSRLMPACRDCGCVLFAPLLRSQLADARGGRAGAAPLSA